MPLVTNQLSPVPNNRSVQAKLIAPSGWRDSGAIEVVAIWRTQVANDGAWSLDLPAQSSYVITGTHYLITEADVEHRIVIPDGPGPHSLYSLLVDPVPGTGGQLATLRLSQLADTGDLATAAIGEVPTFDGSTWIASPAPSGADHGLMTGLADDDHPQYQIRVEKGAVSGYAGLDAAGDVPIGQLPVGAVAGTVAAGDDARLSDARTPTAHAASHAALGSDPVSPAAIGAAASGHAHPGEAVFVGPEGAAPDPAVYAVWIVEP